MLKIRPQRQPIRQHRTILRFRQLHNIKSNLTPKPNTTPVVTALSTLTVTATPKPNATPATTQMQTPDNQSSPTPTLISTDALKATPTPLVMVPFVEDDGAASQDAPVTEWLGATAVLMVLLLATGTGAMLYRRRTARSGEDDESDDDALDRNQTKPRTIMTTMFRRRTRNTKCCDTIRL